MATGGRIALRLWLPLLATIGVLLPIAPARAGCSLDDLLNAVANTVESIGSSSCAAACDTGAGCGAAVGVTAALAGVATEANQASVNTFCSDISNLIQQVNKGSDDANSVVNALQQATNSSIGQDLLDDLSSAVGSVADPLGVAQCACSVEQGLGQLGSAFGACLQDFLCAGDALLGNPCTCQAPAPLTADCAQSNITCGNFNDADPACAGGSASSPTIVSGQNGQTIPGYVGVSQQTNSSGTIVIGGGSGSDGHGHCAPTFYCFCPAPMKAVWTQDTVQNDNQGVPAGTSGWYIFSCQCPSGTHADPSGKTLAGISACLCDNSNQTANFAPDSFGGMCPQPNCPTGQIRLSGNGKCVTPCSNPSEGMTLDGACCNPAQMTSCGTCCPPGTTPDPATGTCLPPQTIQ
jgi:hypothetical protein